MDFDKIIDRHGTNSSKWDKMEKLFGVSPEDGLAMWTADSDYPTAPCVIDAIKRAADHGVFGYSWEYPAYLDAVAWWMKTRHNWDVDPQWVLTSQGLGNAIALCLNVWSEPGDGVVIFTPVYHEFAIKIRKNNRQVVECPLALNGDQYELDLDDAQARLTGNEKILIWCSPQNPSGRVWTEDELRAVADFADRNGLLLVSDEIHHDLVYPGNTFVPMAVAAPDAQSRVVTLTASSKTFNIAGQRTGNIIIPDNRLRAEMHKQLNKLDYAPGMVAVAMITAAYSPEGAAWVDEQIAHLARNKALFDEGINSIPGVSSMPLQATYLAWVNFAGTGMSHEEVTARIRDDAKIAVSPGPAFGTGGDGFQRFNLATQGARVEEAVARMKRAFSDLQ
ncbi:pyridoxal phosphate-dependent aminotransferase [Aliiroseovarius sp. Z3]|uniref:MalY/PatB family protein n=1 Tax=Aliiroseovarius sp. Z3 TaxID=2811402 RepID=UPI0023B33EEE|nr:MalY/PatB family protein [Aliiroseovarius sp. Z3]MDE9451410.1 pyridoxal phosphate-dependent aminotransferase [Aliiroseovarius sp. Z3]